MGAFFCATKPEAPKHPARFPFQVRAPKAAFTQQCVGSLVASACWLTQAFGAVGFPLQSGANTKRIKMDDTKKAPNKILAEGSK
jgi:hypothetical protein